MKSVIKVALVLAVGLSAESARSTQGPWPDIQITEVTVGLEWAAEKVHLDLPVFDATGSIVYRLVCRGGKETYLDSLAVKVGVNYVGPLMCILNSGNWEREESLLGDGNRAPWFSRGQFFTHELVGRCGEYPEYGRTRHFRVRGLRLTIEAKDLELSSGKIRHLTFHVRIEPDPLASTAFAESVPGPDPRAVGGVCNPESEFDAELESHDRELEEKG